MVNHNPRKDDTMPESFLCAFCDCHGVCDERGACQNPDGKNDGWLDLEAAQGAEAADDE